MRNPDSNRTRQSGGHRLTTLYRQGSTKMTDRLILAEIRERAREIVRDLTIEEKAALTVGRDSWTTQPIGRLGVPSIWLTDGPSGVRKAPTPDAAGFGDSIPATCFP